MSELRKQLQTLRDQHREIRYPGDLAGDVLGRSHLSGWWIAGGAIAAMLAVALIAYVVMHRDGSSPTQLAANVEAAESADSDMSDEVFTMTLAMVPSLTELSFDSMVPSNEEGASFPEAPGFPSWTDGDEDATTDSVTK